MRGCVHVSIRDFRIGVVGAMRFDDVHAFHLWTGLPR